MKIPKQINVKTTLILIAIAVIATSTIFYAFAATPTSSFYITGGVYPGAPTYTAWREGSNYFVKDANGQIKYSGTTITPLQNAINDLYNAQGGTLFLRVGTYVGNIWLRKYVSLIGENFRSTVIQGTVKVNNSVILSPVYLSHVTVDAKTAGEDYGLELQGTVGDLHVFDCRFAGVKANMYLNGTDMLECTFENVELAWSGPVCMLIEGHLYVSRFKNIFFGHSDYGLIQNSTNYVMWDCTFNELIFSAMDKKAMHIERMQSCVFNNLYVGDPVAGADQPLILLKNTIDTTVCFGNEFHGGTLNARNNEYVLNISDYYDGTKLFNVDFNKAGVSKIRIDSTATNTLIDSPVNLAFADIDDDSASTHYRGIGWDRGASFPTSPKTGHQFYRTDLLALYIWNSTHWVVTGQGATGPAGPPGGLEGAQPYSYLIFENATSKYLQDGSDGSIITNNADASVLVQYVVDNYETWWLHFTEGVFECNTQVDFGTETYFMITGSGWCTELELNSNLGTGVDFWEFDYTALSHGRFIIRDLYFDMAGDTYTSRDCISIVGGERWKFENIKVLKPYRDGLNIDETGGTGYTRYFTVESFQVYYAGRYGVYCDGRDGNFFDVQIEYSWDTCFVFDTGGVGCSVFRLHSTGAHNTGEYYGSGVGGGLLRYAGLEIRGTVGGGNTVHGVYLDRCNKTGAYITGSNNALVGGRVYECNYQAASSAYADVYIDGDYNRVVGMELNGQASNPTNYGVHLDTGSNNCAVTSNIGRDHAIADFQDDGTANQVGYNG